MRYFTIILTLVLFTSCKGNKSISNTNSRNDFRGKVTQINQNDIKELYRSECSGSVIDQISHEKIPFATVILNSNIREYREHADKTGNFKIDNIIGGNYQIKVLILGYYPLADSVNIEIGKNTEFIIELKIDSEIKL